jgi:tetratricopeptide (TPR) repeat protein
MLPGPILYLFCPKCHAVTTRPTLSSGNTFGARRWTDGKMIADMLPEFTDIIRCINCQSFFWVDDAEVRGWDPWGEFRLSGEEPLAPDWVKQIGQTHTARDLTREEYIEAISGNVANTREREKYLRVRLWWAYNDQLRNPSCTDTNIHKDPMYIDNLSKLEQILDENIVDEIIMKAEANRELGNFDRAIELLGDIPGELKEIADLIIKLAKYKDAKVQKIVKAGMYEEPEEAIEAYKQAIRIKPDDAKVHLEFGFSFLRLGIYKEAIEAYKQAIRIKPDDAMVHRKLGSLYVKLGMHRDAIEAFKQVIRIKPDDDWTHLELGFFYEQLGMYKESIEAYKQARKIDPDFADYLCMHHLLTLKKAEGGFEIDEEASAMLNVTVSQLRDIAESISIKLEADRFDLLSTALILAILRETFSDQIDFWREAVSESENWLEAEIERVKPTIKGIPLLEWIEEYIKESLQI